MNIRCTVRGCGELLVEHGKALACSRNHLFDRARSGYVNLLQPQDRRSKKPGDSADAVAARRRLIDSGLEDVIVDAIVETASGLRPGPVLDIGCGEGSVLDRVQQARSGDAVGLDISTSAIDLAARSFPAAVWIVANADRFLPFENAAFALATSITSRRNAGELHRVLDPRGSLLVVVPAADDLCELRHALYGQYRHEDPRDRIIRELGSSFRLRDYLNVRTTARVGRSVIDDLLASTYRGARRAEREMLSTTDALEVTFARDVFVLSPT